MVGTVHPRRRTQEGTRNGVSLFESIVPKVREVKKEYAERRLPQEVWESFLDVNDTWGKVGLRVFAFVVWYALEAW